MNPRQELAALTGSRAFVRRAKTDDAMYVSDAPRRLEKDALSLLEYQLNQNGFDCHVTENGLWKIDLTDSRLFALLHTYPDAENADIPEKNEDLPVYGLFRILKKHPAPWKRQPREIIRALLKRMDQPREEMNRISQPILEICAEKLRKGMTLPSEAAPMLAYWLNHKEGKA